MDDQQTDDIQQIPSQSPDFQTELAKKLQEIAPEVIADGKVDTQKLKELLDSDTADDSERFGLFWPGKKRAMRAAQEPTTATLKPAKDESKDWDTTENIFIEGDNLEVLKVLQKHYHNRIKMIYIDPPYNTGKDFVYPDNYQEGLASYLEFTRQVDEEGRKISTNSDTEGRYHSNWLNMMYPRLKLARNLLTDEGVIFVSIGEDEVRNLIRICDEIFGERNLLGIVARRTKSGGNAGDFYSPSIDYILTYSRNAEKTSHFKLPISEKILSTYNLTDSEGAYKWRSWYDPSLTLERSKNARYGIKAPDGSLVYPPEGKRWRNVETTFLEKLSNNEIDFREKGNSFIDENGNSSKWSVYYKLRAPSEDQGTTPENIILDAINSLGSQELNELKIPFDFSKPSKLISHLIRYCFAGDKNGIVLDFFSGSGTTGHAVMQLNTEIDGDIKHIQVQLPEPTDEKSDAFKSGYRSIADISKERLRRAGEKIKDDYSDKIAQRDTPLDVGFKVYKLADTNFSKWRTSSETDEKAVQQQLLEIRESSNDAATEEDLLTEVLLKQGISLTAKVQHQDISGLSVWNIGDTTVLAYLNEEVKPNLEQLRAMAELEPGKIIVLEDAFQGDDELKTNLAQICKTNKIELWTV